MDLDATVRGISDDRANGRCLTRTELMLLCAVTIFIWGLLLLPIILYQIPVVNKPDNNAYSCHESVLPLLVHAAQMQQAHYAVMRIAASDNVNYVLVRI